jgi:putative ABC transport system permease protein
VDRNQPLLPLPDMSHIVAEARSPVRFGLILMGTFSLLALIVATLGLYAVVEYGAASRSHEIGVRIALGAQRADIQRLIFGGALRLAGTGIVLAVLGALAASRLLAGMVFGISATDPGTFAAVALLLLLVATVAAWQPARRAADADPMWTIRAE